MTTGEVETLAHLVAERAGTGRALTFAALSERSVDPETGYQPSANLLWKISKAMEIKVNPALIRAIAAGLGLPHQRVAAAATRQYIGYEIGDPFNGEYGDVLVAHRPGMTAEDMPIVRSILERWEREEQEAAECTAQERAENS